MSKKILLIIANKGFQSTEYNVPKKILTDAGFHVYTATNNKNNVSLDELVATGHDESTVKADYVLEDINAVDFDGIFVIGGPGALENLDNYETYKVVEDANLIPSILFGAICISTRILANAGVLNGRRVTGWDGDGELQHVLDEAGATYVKVGVVVDRNLITATGPSAAKEFGEAIVEASKHLLY